MTNSYTIAVVIRNENLVDIRTAIKNDKYSNYSYSKVWKEKTATKTTTSRIAISYIATVAVYKRDLNLLYYRKITNLN